MTPEMLSSLFVFILAVMLGAELIQKVPQTLHTPLMSGSNAISGITIVGGIAAVLAIESAGGSARWFALGAIVLASVNVAGGFLVTDRMLRMFKRR